MFISRPYQNFYLPLTVESWSRLRLVIKNLLNLLQNLIIDLLVNLKCLEVILKLLNLCRTENDSADIGVLESPGKRELGDVSTEALSDFGQLLDLLDLGLAGFSLKLVDGVLEEGLVGGESRVLGDSVVVLAGQEAGGERGPDCGAVLELVEERSVLDLEALTVESVVLRLLNDCTTISICRDLSYQKPYQEQ